jgi:hypothetical protein
LFRPEQTLLVLLQPELPLVPVLQPLMVLPWEPVPQRVS